MKDIDYIHPVSSLGKRLMDIVISSLSIILTLYLYPLISLAIIIDSRGPIFYKQLRVGRLKNNYVSIFIMYKFRTMQLDAEKKTGPVLATVNDFRITRVGRFLRKSRLDELPQMWNVLIGDMSIVGPRPERPLLCRRLENKMPFFLERTYGVTPGITGLAQINLSYEAASKDLDNKLAYDHAYALAISEPWMWLKIDLGIMLKTIIVMFSGKG